jgi:glyceraldehyde-3-phosphate dehydrogenase/erythrose-4-phosphate dehydrogenase
MFPDHFICRCTVEDLLNPEKMEELLRYHRSHKEINVTLESKTNTIDIEEGDIHAN